jgi:adenylate cyclase
MGESFNNISIKDILDQVERICNHPDFISKKLLCSFLRFVLDETLAGRGNDLKGYTIGVEVLGKDKDFDPEQDSLVRIHAGRLRRLLKMYYLEEGKDDPIMIDIPKGSYQVEINYKTGLDVEHGPEAGTSAGTTLQPAIEPTVAILPFKNLSGNPGNDYFAHGLSEEISIELTKYEDLRIISCWNRPESDIENMNDLYSRFGAHFLIDGGVQLNDNYIRVFIKLIDTVTNEQIWAKKYNRNLSIENLIEIEESISEEIARIIGSEYGIIFHQLTEEANRHQPKQIDVFNAILSFYFFEAHQSPELATKTFHILEEANKIDPSSGKIYAMLATMYGNAFALDLPNSETALEKMNGLMEKAMTLDPDSQIVHLVNLFRWFLNNAWDRFNSELNHCMSMNLNSPLRLGILGFYLSLVGEWDQSKVILDKAMNQNIGYPHYFHGATSLYFYRINEFEKGLEEACRYDIPGLFWGPMLRAANLGQLNRKKEAREQIKYLKKLKPDFEEKAAYLIGRFVKEDELVEKVMEGLRKAGMKILTKSIVY